MTGDEKARVESGVERERRRRDGVVDKRVEDVVRAAADLKRGRRDNGGVTEGAVKGWEMERGMGEEAQTASGITEDKEGSTGGLVEDGTADEREELTEECGEG